MFLQLNCAWWLCNMESATCAQPLMTQRNMVVLDGSIVRLLLPGARFRAPRLYQVLIKTLTGKTIDLSSKVAPWMTIEELKFVIQAAENVAPDLQRLIYNGRQLEDGRTLEDYDITHGTSVHLVIRLKGC